MADDSINLEYRIKEITTTFNEQHDTIILTEIVEFCGQNDLLEYKVSVDTLREALNFYFEYKNRQKGKWELYKSKVDCYDVAGVKTWANKYRCCNCGFIYTVIEDFGHYDFCPHCGADMKKVEGSLWDKAIKADDIKKDDEWMQDDKWDEIYKEAKE